MEEDRGVHIRDGRLHPAAPRGARDRAALRWFGRLLDSVPLQHVTAVVCTLAVIAYSASAFEPIAPNHRELLIALISGSLGWLMLASLNRQQRAVGELLALPIDLGNTSLYDILLQQAMRGDFGPVDPEPEARERVRRFYRDVP